MKRMRVFSRLAVLVFGLVLSNAAMAQQQDDVDPDGDKTVREVSPPETEPEEEQVDADDDQAEAINAEPLSVEVPLRRQVMELTKLQNEMKKKLDLSRTQETAIDALFKGYLRTLRQRVGPQRPGGEQSEDTAELWELRRKVIEARKAGDQQTGRQLREQFKQKLRSRSSPTNIGMWQLFDDVSAELDGEQRRSFRKLIMRFPVGHVRRPHGGELRALQRAVMSPDVDLSEEQRQAVRGVMRDGVASVRKMERDSDQAKQIIAKVSADVFEILTPEQRTKVEVILKQDAQRGPRDRPMHRRDRHRQADDDIDSDEDEPH